MVITFSGHGHGPTVKEAGTDAFSVSRERVSEQDLP